MTDYLPKYKVTQLPSRFMGYPEGTEIFVSPYDWGDTVRIKMTNANSLNFMKEILNGVKVDGLAKNLLTPQDILFLGVYRNLVSSSHDKIDIKSICPYCLAENHTAKTLEAIKFNDIEDFTREDYPIEVDFDNYTMWFTFITYKDFELCQRKFRGDTTYQVALQVCKYQDKVTKETVEKPSYVLTDKDSTIKNILEYAKTVRDILASFLDEDKDTLEEVINILEDYGMKPIEVECSDKNCQKKYEVEFDDKEVFVTPFRETKNSPRDRIRLHKNRTITDSIEPDESETRKTTSRTSQKETE